MHKGFKLIEVRQQFSEMRAKGVDRVKEKLENRDFSDVTTDKLLDIFVKHSIS